MVWPILGILGAGYAAYKALSSDSDSDTDYDEEDERQNQRLEALAKARAARKKKAVKRAKFVEAKSRLKQAVNDSKILLIANAGLQQEKHFKTIPFKAEELQYVNFDEDFEKLDEIISNKINLATESAFKTKLASPKKELARLDKLIKQITSATNE